MSKSINRIELMGNVGMDPELKMTNGGVAVCKFSIATSDRYKDNKTGEYVDSPTQWHRCELWGKAGESLAKNLSKGERVMVVGSVEYQDFTANDGSKKTSTIIRVKDYYLLGSPKPSVEDKPSRESGARKAGFGRGREDDLPF